MGGHAGCDGLGQAAHSGVDKQFRAAAYSEMTTIFLEHLPWIPVIQPMESYGVRRNLQWRPCPNRQLEIRRFNLRARWD